MRDRTWEIMTKHLEADVYDVVAAGDDAPTSKTMNAFAKSAGCSIPDEFIAHSCGRYGGLCVQVKEAFWSRPKELDVGPFWSFCYGLYTFTSTSGAPEFMAARSQTPRLREMIGQPVVPCLKIFGDADVYVIDSSGRLQHWDHEQGLLNPYAGSFFDLLDEELAALADRKNRKLHGGNP